MPRVLAMARGTAPYRHLFVRSLAALPPPSPLLLTPSPAAFHRPPAIACAEACFAHPLIATSIFLRSRAALPCRLPLPSLVLQRASCTHSLPPPSSSVPSRLRVLSYGLPSPSCHRLCCSVLCAPAHCHLCLLPLLYCPPASVSSPTAFHRPPSAICAAARFACALSVSTLEEAPMACLTRHRPRHSMAFDCCRWPDCYQSFPRWG
jgi:hypothetical protein